MSKRKSKVRSPSHHKGHAQRNKKKIWVWQGLFALAVLVGVTLTYVGLYRPAPSRTEQASGNQEQRSRPLSSPSLSNRLVLPAGPRKVRPPTLEPGSFLQPEVMNAYYVARDIPEVLEHLPCYCGCYASVGHRNNLDCFTDNHGVT